MKIFYNLTHNFFNVRILGIFTEESLVSQKGKLLSVDRVLQFYLIDIYDISCNKGGLLSSDYIECIRKKINSFLLPIFEGVFLSSQEFILFALEFPGSMGNPLRGRSEETVISITRISY